MKTLTATSARSDLFNILKQTVKGHLQTRITSKEGNAILISEEDFESLVETQELLSIKGLKDSIDQADKEINEGETFSLKEVF